MLPFFDVHSPGKVKLSNPQEAILSKQREILLVERNADSRKTPQTRVRSISNGEINLALLARTVGKVQLKKAD